MNGGAAIAASRLNAVMREAGIDSRMLVATSNRKSASVSPMKQRKQRMLFQATRILLNLLKNRILHPSFTFSLCLHGVRVTHHPWMAQADVIYLHWTQHCFVSLKEVRRLLSLGKPVVLFLHDMWWMTGGCHYSFECEQYKSSCRACPLVGRSCMRWITRYVLHLKQRYMQPYSNLYVVAPSHWMASCAGGSALLGTRRIEVIPNMIHEGIFKPLDRNFAREALGLPKDKKLVLFGANGGTVNPYKGWSCLLDALPHIQTKEVELVVFGAEMPEAERARIPFRIHSLGYLTDQHTLALVYNASDVFVLPSLAENLSLSVIESLSCGTYVVGFDVGGNADMIKHHQTGYLARYKDSADLARGIDWVLSAERPKQHTRAFTDAHFASNRVVSQHIDFLNQILS